MNQPKNRIFECIYIYLTFKARRCSTWSIVQLSREDLLLLVVIKVSVEQTSPHFSRLNIFPLLLSPLCAVDLDFLRRTYFTMRGDKRHAWGVLFSFCVLFFLSLFQCHPFFPFFFLSLAQSVVYFSSWSNRLGGSGPCLYAHNSPGPKGLMKSKLTAA